MRPSSGKETSSRTHRFGGVYAAAVIVLAVIGCLASALADAIRGEVE